MISNRFKLFSIGCFTITFGLYTLGAAQILAQKTCQTWTGIPDINTRIPINLKSKNSVIISKSRVSVWKLVDDNDREVDVFTRAESVENETALQILLEKGNYTIQYSIQAQIPETLKICKF
jgi:hypothetical protein